MWERRVAISVEKGVGGTALIDEDGQARGRVVGVVRNGFDKSKLPL